MADELDPMNMRNLRKLAGTRGVRWKGLNREELLAALRAPADGDGAPPDRAPVDAAGGDERTDGDGALDALADLEADTLVTIAAEYGIVGEQPYADRLAAVQAAVAEHGLTDTASRLLLGAADVEIAADAEAHGDVESDGDALMKAATTLHGDEVKPDGAAHTHVVHTQMEPGSPEAIVKVAGLLRDNPHLTDEDRAQFAEPLVAALDGAALDGAEKRAAAAEALAKVVGTERDALADGRLPILRQTASAWWCPRCDRSAMTTIDVCPGCHARRHGDEVELGHA